MSYLNTKPLVYGFEKGMMKEELELVMDYPANIASMLIKDEIDIGLIVTNKSEYVHDFNGTSEVVTDKFYSNMGCNGTVTLEFTTPFYLWLLENM